MTRLPRISGPALLVGILALPTVARADTIRITSGAAISRNERTGVPEDVGIVEVTIASADHGFSLAAGGDVNGGGYDLFTECVQGSGCEPETVHSLAMSWIGSDFTGTATADGLTFHLGLLSEAAGSALVDFEGTWMTPPFTGRTTASVTAPFTFTGLVAYPAPPSDPNQPYPFPRSEDLLIGSGVARIDLAWEPNASFGAWRYTGARYEFAATPEPATLLLVAPFALGLARWRKVTRVDHC